MVADKKYYIFVLLVVMNIMIGLLNIKNFPKLQLYLQYKNYSKNKIQIIYFSHINEAKWKNIIIPQMKGLIDCGLLSKADLLVTLSGDKKIVELIELTIRNLLKDQSESYISFIHYYENLFEYPGIKALYESAKLNPGKIFLYFHSKGMWFGNEQYQDGRTILEKNLYDSVVVNWKNALKVFDTKPDVSKICFGGSNGGWCWFNFYWVRGAYLNTCRAPRINRENRYYYEGYLGTTGCMIDRQYPYSQTHEAYQYNFNNSLPYDTYMGVYNIAANNTVPFFFPGEITDYLKGETMVAVRAVRTKYTSGQS